MNRLEKLKILCEDAKKLHDSDSKGGAGHVTEKAANAVYEAGLGSVTLYASLDAKEYSLTAMRMHRTQKPKYAEHFHRMASKAVQEMIDGIQSVIDS